MSKSERGKMTFYRKTNEPKMGKNETTKKVREIKLTRKGKDKREQNTWLIFQRKGKKSLLISWKILQ